MLPRSIYYIVAAVLFTISCFFLFRNRSGVKNWTKKSTSWASNKARTAYGHVANAADRVMHTERPPEVA